MASNQSKQGRAGAAKAKTSAKSTNKLEKTPVNGKAKAKGPGKKRVNEGEDGTASCYA